MIYKISNVQSSEPELTETFLVKLLSLELLPDVLITGGQNQDLNSMITVVMAHVFIEEHGNPRGSVQFYVERVSGHLRKRICPNLVNDINQSFTKMLFYKETKLTFLVDFLLLFK